mmetsp:Transcript_24088/g.65222  ORF Transcript_24088/g.65222 Transcript_24088/m.65222 type:complete len:119 (+) Transcript_24088:963-1319(+)
MFGAFLEELMRFWNKGLEPYLGCAEWAGKAYFGVGALVGFVVERSRGWFKYTRDEILDEGKDLSSCGQVYLYQVCDVATFATPTAHREHQCRDALHRGSAGRLSYASCTRLRTWRRRC